MKKIVVTGGAGFIGSHLVDFLVESGFDVCVVDDFSTGRKENIAGVLKKIKLFERDINDTEFITKIFSKVDSVIHLAAIPSVPKSIKFPVETNTANAVGTLSVFIAARDAGVKRVIYASSSSIYGDTVSLPKVETMIPCPLSPYAEQKLRGELYGSMFYKMYEMETIGLRYFNVFGPRQSPDSEYAAVIPKFIHCLKNGERPVIFGDGHQTRDFTYIENVINANICALNTGSGFGNVYNIAAGIQVSLNELVEKLNLILGTSISPVYEAPRSGDIRDSFADVTKAKMILGYEPMVSFEEGLRRTIKAIP